MGHLVTNLKAQAEARWGMDLRLLWKKVVWALLALLFFALVGFLKVDVMTGIAKSRATNEGLPLSCIFYSFFIALVQSAFFWKFPILRMS